ncbi:excinuclease ABC subunit UvrC [Candidatus Fermentibacteria bacterium]|nr:excinuclease ABC subunit UvrC [Candidatus Fermentibacteria bacterium]
MGRKALSEIADRAPDLSGVYRFIDDSGKILYIGKALSIRKRLKGHLGTPGDARHERLLERAGSIEWTTTRSEMEALVLEAELVRLHKPPLNVRLKSDRRYPYLEITTDEEYPRLVVTRVVDPGRDVPRFGPYPDARSLRKLVELLQSAFPVRRCKTGEVTPRDRPCLMGQMGRCPAPCVGECTELYESNVRSVRKVLEGDWKWARTTIRERMDTASRERRFEEAARWRDLLKRLESLGWPAPEALHDMLSRDVLVVRDSWGLVMQMRGGRLMGVVRLPFAGSWKEAPAGERLEVLLRTYYSETDDIPREVLLSEEPPDAGLLAEWLSDRRGSVVRITVPRRGGKRELVELGTRDLTDFLARMEWRYPRSRERAVQKAMRELTEVLGLESEPRWIVGMDASTIQGTYSVAALVSFRDGRPDKDGYRRFSMERSISGDDPAMIRDAVGRYLRRLDERLPDLFLIDGGIAQHRSALKAAGRHAERIVFVSLAKRDETLLVGSEERSPDLPPDSPALTFLRMVRDEAHRFVLHYHRLRRSKGTLRSMLEDIPGVGPVTRAALLRKFGSIGRLREAEESELLGVPGIGRKKAAAILEFAAELKPEKEER